MLHHPEDFLDFEMEPPQHGKLTSLFASVSITNTPDTNMGIPPNFESLPPELILNIFEFVPEAICEFRRTSQALKALADEFVQKRPTICIVNEININDHYYRYDDKEAPGSMRIWMEVPIRTASLFELRVKSCGVNQTAKMGRNVNEIRGAITYGVSLKMPVANDPNTEWERLAESIGFMIEEVALSIHETDLATIFSLLTKFQIEKLNLDIDKFSEIGTSALLETVKHHKLEWLALRMTETATAPYLAEFLLELSTHVRSLHIRGYFAINAQWAPLIIEMFSKKLDTLYMNHWRDQILSREDADRLIAHLPFIGKKVWFKVGFALNTIGRSNKINGHIIHETCPARKTNKPAKDRALSIIHKSRLKEVSPQ
ncbi:hypothetical protein PRIPAC_82401 [Pristionchus pacificus]|nr:hypothetical protein PRIPAC_82401 [Pristionchus pacificus]